MEEELMRRAIELSRIHMRAGDGGPFGAVIVKDGVIVAEGWNKVSSTNDPTAHAEVSAIRAASQALGTFDLSSTELYTSCEPCPMCLAATYWARIPKLYYASTKDDAAAHDFDDAHIYEELGRHPTLRKVPMLNLLRAEACEVFAEWAAKPDKVPY